jgi:hypothetical protein
MEKSVPFRSVKFEEALKEESEKPKSNGFINSTKISLNYKMISSIVPIKSPLFLESFRGVKKLYLSHNNLRSLEGLEYFTFLTHLSISYNKIYDLEELSHVGNQYGLVNLSIKGNFFDKHPDIRNLVLHYFPNLEELDNQQVNKKMRGLMSHALYLRKMMVPLWYKLEKAHMVAEQELSRAKDQASMGSNIFARDE